MDICLKGNSYTKGSLSSIARLLNFSFEFGRLHCLVTLTGHLSSLLLPSVKDRIRRAVSWGFVKTEYV